ncbi:MAG: hypothetical protein CMN76_20870 [Spirochaetaceae bacterium]|nr:hypothetical protein [Spirochaetaceae bacterium]|tara:strand:- start:94960 stop:95745 length:786 start_codon:yes stop_codon:yes gene_type:complete
MAGFFQRLFAKVRRKKKAPPPPSDQQIRSNIEDLISSIQSKLNAFLITRKSESGLVEKSAKWSLHKNHTGLFRLDAEGFSILLFTEPFLVKRQDKVQGLLPISEVELCRAARQKDPVAFLRSAQPPSGKGYSIYESLLGSRPEGDALPAIDDLLSWPNADLHRLIARCRMNVVAHVLVQSTDAIRKLILSNTSRRYKEMMITELESLKSPGSDPDLNPGSRNLGLLEFEKALEEFRQEMQQFRREDERREARRRRMEVRGR